MHYEDISGEFDVVDVGAFFLYINLVRVKEV